MNTYSLRERLTAIRSKRNEAEEDIATLVSLLKCLQRTDYDKLDSEDIQYALSVPCFLSEKMHDLLDLCESAVETGERAIDMCEEKK